MVLLQLTAFIALINFVTVVGNVADDNDIEQQQPWKFGGIIRNHIGCRQKCESNSPNRSRLWNCGKCTSYQRNETRIDYQTTASNATSNDSESNICQRQNKFVSCTQNTTVISQAGIFGCIRLCVPDPNPYIQSNIENWTCGECEVSKEAAFDATRESSSFYNEERELLNNAPSAAPTDPPTPIPIRRSPTHTPTRTPIQISPPIRRSPTQSPTQAVPISTTFDAPTKAPKRKSPTRRPTKAPIKKSPTRTPTRKPTQAVPISTAFDKPTKAPIRKSPTRRPTKTPVRRSPTRTPTRRPTQEVPISTSIDTPTQAPVGNSEPNRCKRKGLYEECGDGGTKIHRLFRQNRVTGTQRCRSTCVTVDLRPYFSTLNYPNGSPWRCGGCPSDTQPTNNQTTITSVSISLSSLIQRFTPKLRSKSRPAITDASSSSSSSNTTTTSDGSSDNNSNNTTISSSNTTTTSSSRVTSVDISLTNLLKTFQSRYNNNHRK